MGMSYQVEFLLLIVFIMKSLTRDQCLQPANPSGPSRSSPPVKRASFKCSPPAKEDRGTSHRSVGNPQQSARKLEECVRLLSDEVLYIGMHGGRNDGRRHSDPGPTECRYMCRLLGPYGSNPRGKYPTRCPFLSRIQARTLEQLKGGEAVAGHAWIIYPGTSETVHSLQLPFVCDPSHPRLPPQRERLVVRKTAKARWEAPGSVLQRTDNDIIKGNRANKRTGCLHPCC
ncbi:uncharacterized protein LOC119977566 [Scyliorhinus canicula]|uniref:uncharacterized protein LOC119977566 n=1 Tax=Scyliorhinus canicula TaxID=7830 RepID=UPI0018F54765|nr:uncharacterized protein LOC119977566 [Scyliorhinus canicula]